MADFWTLASKVVDAEMGKFTIFFLMVFFILSGKANKKLQTDLLNLLTSNIAAIKDAVDDATKETVKKVDALKDSAHELGKEFLQVKFELMQELALTKAKLEEKQKAIDELGEGNAMVVKLMMEYQEHYKTLKNTADRFISILNDKKNERDSK